MPAHSTTFFAMEQKLVIYQMLPRLFANRVKECVPDGTVEQNGSGKLNNITLAVLKAIKGLGVSHIWYTGVIEHAHCTDYSAYGICPDNKYIVKGKAGSPYAIKDYYDIDPDLAEDVPARMAEFEALVKRTHDAGLKVVMDFVPNHVARRYHSDSAPAGAEDFGAYDDDTYGFAPDNNFYYITCQQFAPGINLGEGNDRYVEFPAKASGNDCFTAFPGVNDWYETVKLNYGVDPWDGSRHFSPEPDTWRKMKHILNFWAGKGVDAFRCDMAHMVPVEFWHSAIADVKSKYPCVKFIAEIYDMNLYRPYIEYGGFDYLYDKVNLYDTLCGIMTGNVSAAQITGCWQRVDGLGGNMLNFLENHDELRIASRFFAGNPFAAVPALVVSALISTGPVMIYAGQELGEKAEGASGFSGDDGRTTIFDYWNIPTVQRWLGSGGVPSLRGLSADEKRLRAVYSTVLGICSRERAVTEGCFFDLMYVHSRNPRFNPHRHDAFMRYCDGELLFVAVNFDASDADIEVNIPAHAFEHMGLPQRSFAAADLMSGDKTEVELSENKPLGVTVPGYGAVVYKMLCNDGDNVDKKTRRHVSRKSKK